MTRLVIVYYRTTAGELGICHTVRLSVSGCRSMKAAHGSRGGGVLAAAAAVAVLLTPSASAVAAEGAVPDELAAMVRRCRSPPALM